MPNLRRYAVQEISALADGIRQRLADRALPDWGLRNLLEDFRFRAADGSTWTLGPVTRTWHRSIDGRWSPQSSPPADRLEGLANLRLFGMLPRAGSNEEQAPAGEAPAAGGSPIAYLHHAVERVAAGYAEGRLTSDAAESLLAGIFLVDRAGMVWSHGVRSHKMYAFTGDGWRRDDAPPLLEAADGEVARQKHCTNCGAALQEGVKFCGECGTPVPAAGTGPGDQQVLDKLSTFLTSNAAAYPEPITADWAPVAGLPERLHNCPHCGALNVGEVEACVSCTRPLAPVKSPPPAARASASPSVRAAPPVSQPAPQPIAPDAPAPAAAPPSMYTPPPAKRRSRTLWFVGGGCCLLIVCLAITAVVIFGLGLIPMSDFPGIGAGPLPADPQPQPVAPADTFPSSTLLEDTFDDPSRTAVPLFGPDAMEFEIDTTSGFALMTAHNPGVLVATYEEPIVADFVATLELSPLNPVPGGGYGMIFRSDDAADGLADYYLLLASPADGNVVLSRWGPGGFSELGSVPFTLDASGNISLLVRAQAGHIEVEVDGQPGIQVLDAAAEPGIFGLAVLSPRDGDAVMFDEFIVTLLNP